MKGIYGKHGGEHIGRVNIYIYMCIYLHVNMYIL